MPVWNRTANFLGIAVIAALVYFGWTFLPPLTDDYVLKNSAKAYISGSREEKDEEVSRKRFFSEARGQGINLQDESCSLERLPNGQEARVSCRYSRDTYYPFTQKKYTFKFSWVVQMKFRTY